MTGCLSPGGRGFKAGRSCIKTRQIPFPATIRRKAQDTTYLGRSESDHHLAHHAHPCRLTEVRLALNLKLQLWTMTHKHKIPGLGRGRQSQPCSIIPYLTVLARSSSAPRSISLPVVGRLPTRTPAQQSWLGSPMARSSVG